MEAERTAIMVTMTRLSSTVTLLQFLAAVSWLSWAEGEAGCYWKSDVNSTTSVVCVLGRGASSKTTHSRPPSQPNSLEIRCRDGEDGLGVLNYLRDVIDIAVAAAPDGLLLSPDKVDSLLVSGCPFSRLQRLDLLYISSSVSSKLKSLKISSNGEVGISVDQDAFREAPRSLKTVDLSGNNIADLTSTLCLLRPAGIRALNLSSNLLTDVLSLGFGRKCSMEGMEELDLSRNDLANLPRNSFYLSTGLKRLDLSRNGLERIADGALEGPRDLEVLDLGLNSLESIPGSLFGRGGGRSMRELYLQENSIKVLPSSLLDGMAQLVVLNLSGNALTTQRLQSSRPSPFSKMSKLVALDLSHNSLVHLGADLFKGLSSLQILTVAGNRIRRISPDSFKAVPRLHALVLSNNRIESLEPGTLDSLDQLGSLAMDHNAIKALNR